MSNANTPPGRPNAQRSTFQAAAGNDSTRVEVCATKKGPCAAVEVNGQRTAVEVCVTPAGPCGKVETSNRKRDAVFGSALIAGVGALAVGATGGVALLVAAGGALVGHAMTEPRPKSDPNPLGPSKGGF
jgi:hypothetical protein